MGMSAEEQRKMKRLEGEVNRLTKELKAIKLTSGPGAAEEFGADVPDPQNFMFKQEGRMAFIQKMNKDYLETTKEIARVGGTYFMNFDQGGKFHAGLQAALDYSQKMTGTYKTGQAVFKKLSTEMKSFVGFSASGIRDLSKQSAIFQQLGLDATSYGKILDSAKLAYGETDAEVMKLGNHLMTLSNRLSIPPQQMAQEFHEAQKTMAYDSKQLQYVFDKLQQTSRTTGVSFSTLTSKFGETMDTFQGSAQVAGRLNAILGDSVFNSIELLGMNEADRVSTIVGSIQNKLSQTGKNVNQLSKFELKAMASSLGLSVGETRRLLLGETSVKDALEKISGEDLDNKKNQALKIATKELGFFEEALKKIRSESDNWAIATAGGMFDKFTKKLSPTDIIKHFGFEGKQVRGLRGVTEARVMRDVFRQAGVDLALKMEIGRTAVGNQKFIAELHNTMKKEGGRLGVGRIRQILNEYRSTTGVDFDPRVRGRRTRLDRQIQKMNLKQTRDLVELRKKDKSTIVETMKNMRRTNEKVSAAINKAAVRFDAAAMKLSKQALKNAKILVEFRDSSGKFVTKKELKRQLDEL